VQERVRESELAWQWALTGGPGSTVPTGSVSNRFKHIQTVPKKFEFLQKFEIKYGWRDLEMVNNFAYKNSSRFEMEFELKFREVSVS
jgi:hypothetical protein